MARIRHDSRRDLRFAEEFEPWFIDEVTIRKWADRDEYGEPQFDAHETTCIVIF